jgi:F-type H+-transporting ATPase subunit delta
MRDQQLGRVRAVVTSAFELTDSQRDMIRSQFGQKLGKQLVLVEKVDPTLLGGVSVRIGDQVYDGTVQGKLSAIRAAVTSGIQKAIRDQYSSLLSS